MLDTPGMGGFELTKKGGKMRKNANERIKVDSTGFEELHPNERSKEQSIIHELRKEYLLTGKEINLAHEYIYPIMKNLVPQMVTDFYVWLEARLEFEKFFAGDKSLIARVKKEQERYWIEMLSLDLDDQFFKKRVNLAKTHARIKLPLDSYFVGMAFFTNWVITKVTAVLKGEGMKNAQEMLKKNKRDSILSGLNGFIKIVQIDESVVVNEYVANTNQAMNTLISRQASTIIKLATPISLLSEGILLVTMIGVLDSKRAQDILETTLTKIVELKAKVTILDIAGVDTVDTTVANYLIKITQAIKLLGCSCILSGISPDIAQSIVQLGVDLKDLTTKAVLQDAVTSAYEIISNTGLLKKSGKNG